MRAVGETAEDGRRELLRLAPAQPRQLGPLDPVDPGQLGQQRPQRVGAVQLVGAERHRDQHVRQRALVADEEREEVAARPVGPVRVLHHQDERLLHGQPLEQGQELLEEPRASLARAVRRAGGIVRRSAARQLGKEPGQLPCGPVTSRQQADELVGPDLAHEVAQHRRERPERQPVGPQLQASADQHPRARRPRLAGELADQPGLADPGLAPDEQGGRTTLRGPRQMRPAGWPSLPPAQPERDYHRVCSSHSEASHRGLTFRLLRRFRGLVRLSCPAFSCPP